MASATPPTTQPTTQPTTKVLFVCLGNICRSPTAEAVFTSVATRKGLRDGLTIDSCGTGGGNPDWCVFDSVYVCLCVCVCVLFAGMCYTHTQINKHTHAHHPGIQKVGGRIIKVTRQTHV